MQPSQQPLNPWLVSYITQHRDTKSRYDIDRYLIEAGYNPAEVEAAWQFEARPDEYKSTSVYLHMLKLSDIFVVLILTGILISLFTLWPLVMAGFAISLPVIIAIIIYWFLLKIRYERRKEAGLRIGRSLILMNCALVVIFCGFALHVLFSTFEWESPTEIATASANNHEYHLTYSASCLNTCSVSLNLYRCIFFNLVCPNIGSSHSDGPFTYPPRLDEPGLLNFEKEKENLSLLIDPATNKISVLANNKTVLISSSP